MLNDIINEWKNCGSSPGNLTWEDWLMKGYTQEFLECLRSKISASDFDWKNISVDSITNHLKDNHDPEFREFVFSKCNELWMRAIRQEMKYREAVDIISR